MIRERRSGKEKVGESFSIPAASKKQRTTGVSIRDTPIEEVQEVSHHGDIPYKAVWGKGALDKQKEAYHAELFYEKIGDDCSIKDNMCFEKSVYNPYFRALGFYKKFTALGWEAVIDFKGDATGDIYVNNIMEWLSTLKKNDGNNPPKTVSLTGIVNGKMATLCLTTLRQLAKFDSKPDNFYKYVNENDYFNAPKNVTAKNTMLSKLSILEKGVAMKRDNLKPLVRVLMTNVAP
ncbi:hypothetical protein HanRHA438_Chr02g0094091 [Helianthus annuus]|nr:hypothetical protein HanIR_Chr02g0095751 [Helianthus annuus]KAJ0778448.1 hypothetical protein HanLR1_Chr02g0071831 [Helianthus annuus]KAJ0787412.1 hypothetical protein HanOQP8_Chr02g0082221 [Helianthus annuus]KAJ0941397.1 hypothetical protein HanRHA438_Chr02g0094091 [Helianthus annuus]